MSGIRDFGWVAGILEGEGCFSVKVRSISITCKMADEDIIRGLYEVTGVGRLTGPYFKENRKPIYSWEVSARQDVICVINSVYPYMGIRRSQKIDLMIAWDAAHPIGAPRKDAAVHGSISMYTNHKCRCDLCRACMEDYRNANKEKIRAAQHAGM